MKEEEVIEKLSGEGAAETPLNTPVDSPSKKSKNDTVNEEIERQKKEAEKKAVEEERLQKLADAKATIDRIDPDSFHDSELAIEAKVYKEKVKELGREAVAEKLERLSIVDKAKKDLQSAKGMKDFSETTLKQLQKIINNQESFNIDSAKEALLRSDEILTGIAKKNLGSKDSARAVDLDSLSNVEYFKAKSNQRKQMIHKSVHSFFHNFSGYMENGMEGGN